MGFLSANSSEQLHDFPKTLTTLTLVQENEQFKEIPSVANRALEYLKQTKKPGSTRFIFMRHGQSEANVTKSVPARSEIIDLTEEGVVQAQKRGAELLANAVQIDAAFSSPSLRSCKTVGLVLAGQGTLLEPLPDERLHERWYGSLEGATATVYAPVIQKEKEDLARMKTFAEKIHYKAQPDMESLPEVYFRNLSFIREVGGTHRGETILVGSHNAVMKTLFMVDSSCRGYDVGYRDFYIANCALFVIEMDENGALSLVATEGLQFRSN